MLPNAYIVHQTRDRVRLRIKEKRNDTGFFALMNSRFESISEDLEVRMNDRLGTVLFIHPGVTFADLFAELDQLDLFEIVAGPEPATYALAPLISSVKWINRTLGSATSGSVDVRTLVFIAAVLIAVRQIRRGEWFSPAFTIVWSSMDMLARAGKEISLEKP